MTIIGYDFYGTQFFRSPSNSLKDIFYGELKNGIYDELEIRDRTDVDLSNIRSTWQIDHRAIFKFLNDLEGGNIQNSGLEIVSFAIKRRKASEIDSITLGHLPFENNTQIEYIDFTQPNDDLIYSIVPIAENDLEGRTQDVSILSDFTGYFLVDKDTNEVVAFDKAIDNVGNVETQLNQGRTVINTLSRFPTVFYNDLEFHSFSLSTVLIPSEFERSGINYEKFLNTFIRQHKPFILKSGTGEIYVCDISNLRKSSPQNTWDGYDFITISIDATEVQDYQSFMTE